MRIEALDNKKISFFIDYCVKYRFEHDESCLYDEDLDSFTPDYNNPTYILLNDEDSIIGVASLIILPYINNTKRGRFRIFHTVAADIKAYRLLFEAIKKHITELDHLYLFIPESKGNVGEILQTLSFSIERYAWVLVRDDIEVPDFSFPQSYSLKTLEFGKDEEDWCKVRNTAFATLKGSETPMQPQGVTDFKEDKGYIEGGLIMLYNNHEPIGVIRVTEEHEDGKDYGFIGPLAIIPEYQGMGIGKNLLRTGLAFGKKANLPYSMLCVNADNDRAADLYLKEGFTKQVVMICYRYQM